VGTREGIESRWSWAFRLDELGTWQECWWQANPRLVNWHQQVGQKTLGGCYKHVEETRVGWGIWSCAIRKVSKVEGGKGPTCAWSKGFGKV
jgi:hypothetical protein